MPLSGRVRLHSGAQVGTVDRVGHRSWCAIFHRFPAPTMGCNCPGPHGVLVAWPDETYSWHEEGDLMPIRTLGELGMGPDGPR